MKRNTALAVILSICLAMVPAMPAAADYRYDEFDEAVPAQAVYVAQTNYNGKQLGIGNFKNPADLYVYQDSAVYILDSGNNRIVVLDRNFQVKQVIDSIVSDGEQVDISAAKGIYVSDAGEIYLSDSTNGRVVILDEQGSFLRMITRPDSLFLTDNINFLPKNVVVDSMGTVYIISENSTQGAYMIGANGDFLGFYGRNEVDVTAEILFQAFMRQFASEAQRATMSSFVPVEFSNFDIDREGFIYTVTGYSSTPKSTDMIRKLNPLGENILANAYRTWGDEPDGEIYSTTYVDVAVDDEGFIYALDQGKGRVFLYDDTGFQIAIFGGYGNTLGTFKTAAAIDTLGDSVIVLDSQKNNITLFNRTQFGELAMTALGLYNQGKMDESIGYFEEITAMDANFTYAYYAMAEIYYDKEQYELSEKYAGLSGVSQEVYSKSKKMMRNDWIRSHFAGVFAAVILGAVVILAVAKVKDAKRKERRLLALTERRSDL